ncbi:MAG: stage II sporulation protein R [Clostridia bacterium]|nr:stage II sporulation protein R [Clostridia bacterium]
MKKICISSICLSIIILTAAFLLPQSKGNEEYLRMHVRANSNGAEDQAVKYAVRDEIVGVLTPVVAECESKEALQNALYRHIPEIERAADRVLEARGFTYRSSAKLAVERFPTRTYGDLTLGEGYYDALIVNLGSGEGDNWWCVVYPPLCFLGGEEKFGYRSRIAELISLWRERHGK